MKPLVAAVMLLLSLPMYASAQPSDAALTVGEVRSSTMRALSSRVLGPYVGSHVIEMERHEYLDNVGTTIPQEIDFYTQPTLAYPRINGICVTDVITVVFDWFEHSEVTPATALKFQHVAAKSRFLAFDKPSAEPGSSDSERLQAAACVGMTTARDAFSAPTAGDAQWLAAMERELSQSSKAVPRYQIKCLDFRGSACANARVTLSDLRLRDALAIDAVKCPPLRWHDQINYCYQLAFPYAGTTNPEWELTLIGGVSDGLAPQKIRSITMKHLLPQMVLN
jgi:hypothetical protein